MKKIFFLLLILLPATCYLLPATSAEPALEIQHETYQPGETIIATIKTLGEFTSQISPSQIEFYQGRKLISLETDTTLYNNTHYLAVYTSHAQNLTMKINNVLYKEDNQLKSITLEKNLTIQENKILNEETNETYLQILKIRPGIIFSKTPSIKLTNPTTSQLNLTINDQEISLEAISSQTFSLSPEDPFSFTSIKTYKEFLVPTIYIKETDNQSNPTFPKVNESEPDLKPSEEFLVLELFTENKTTQEVQLFNFNSSNLTSFETKTSSDFIKLSKLNDMSAKEVQNLTITFEPNDPGHFQETINISYLSNEKPQQIQILLSIFVLPKGTPEVEFEVKSESCSDIQGTVCESGYICSGTAKFTKNSEYCCLATCVEAESKSSSSSGSGWLVGIGIFIILGLAGYGLYKKSKKFQSPTGSEKISQISQNFENKMTGTRTTGSLTKS